MAKAFSRRNFIKGTVAMTMGVVGAYGLSACAPKSGASTSESGDSAASTSSTTATGTAATLHRYYGTIFDNGCTQVVVATAEDGTILGANVDEYTFLASDTEGLMPVPNSDSDFAAGYAEGMVLFSKVDNSTIYSAIMASKGGSTQEWATSMKAIEDFVVGKKAADITSVDTVSGATLKHTADYLKMIATASSDTAITTEGTFGGDAAKLKLGRANTAAHGTKAFCDAVSLVEDKTVVAASIDDFQFFDATATGVVPIASSDGEFGKNYASGVVLGSKSQNSEMYSALMKEKAQATTAWLTSMEAIESFCAGKEIGELNGVAIDAVSGSTLVDTSNYVAAAMTAAEAI